MKYRAEVYAFFVLFIGFVFLNEPVWALFCLIALIISSRINGGR